MCIIKNRDEVLFSSPSKQHLAIKLLSCDSKSCFSFPLANLINFVTSQDRHRIESIYHFIQHGKREGKRGGKKENDPSLLGDLPTKHSSAWPPLLQMHVSKSTCMKLASSSQTATCEPSLLFFLVPRYKRNRRLVPWM